jgi:bacterial/archaeal transporter family-2 protein
MSELGQRVGIVPALAFAVLVSLVCALAALLVWERSFVGVRAALHEPVWLWIGGVMSVFIVFAITVGPPRIGVTATIAIVIAGNLLSAALIDRFGLFGVERVALSWPRLVGFALLALGAALTLKR